MLPARTVRDEVRWFDTCVHDIDIYHKCPACQKLTGDAQEMFAPVEPEEGKDGTHVPDPR
jgi:hypothetical protein